jgi:sugar lactone lactonase YvrE
MPAGLGWTPAGDLLVVSMADRRLLRLEGGSLVEVADLGRFAPWHLNDMVVDADGRAYVGNLGWDDENDPVIVETVLLRVDPDGSVHLAAEELILPDGMALDDEGSLWLGDCRGSGTVRVAEGGARRDFVSTAPHTAFAVALGGPERTTLFLCTGPPYGDNDPASSRDGALWRIPVEVPGAFG